MHVRYLGSILFIARMILVAFMSGKFRRREISESKPTGVTSDGGSLAENHHSRKRSEHCDIVRADKPPART